MTSNTPPAEGTILIQAIASLLDAQKGGLEVTSEPDAKAPCDAKWLRVADSRTSRWMAIVLQDDDVSAIAAALEGGATAIVSIHAPQKDLQLALSALDGDLPLYLSGDIMHQFARGVLGQQIAAPSVEETPVSELPRLTRREEEVLDLVARGYTNREIAEALVVSVNTVRSHLHSLAAKLHGSNRSRIVANALAGGWKTDTGGVSSFPRKRPSGHSSADQGPGASASA